MTRKPTPLQLRILEHIRRNPEDSYQQIADALGCHRSSVRYVLSPEYGARIRAWERSQKARYSRHKSHLSKSYGITPDEYNQLKEAQGGCCAICRRAKGKSKRLAVDHDHHHTGDLRSSVRGLLCTRCNVLLGHLRDDLETVDRIRQYLTNPPARAVLGFGSEGE